MADAPFDMQRLAYSTYPQRMGDRHTPPLGYTTTSPPIPSPCLTQWDTAMFSGVSHQPCLSAGGFPYSSPPSPVPARRIFNDSPQSHFSTPQHCIGYLPFDGDCMPGRSSNLAHTHDFFETSLDLQQVLDPSCYYGSSVNTRSSSVSYSDRSAATAPSHFLGEVDTQVGGGGSNHRLDGCTNTSTPLLKSQPALPTPKSTAGSSHKANKPVVSGVQRQSHSPSETPERIKDEPITPSSASAGDPDSEVDEDEDESSATRYACKSRPFVCKWSGCSLSFQRVNDLDRHHKAVHLKLRPFSCELCLKTFPRKDSARRHFETSCLGRPSCAESRRSQKEKRRGRKTQLAQLKSEVGESSPRHIQAAQAGVNPAALDMGQDPPRQSQGAHSEMTWSAPDVFAPYDNHAGAVYFDTPDERSGRRDNQPFSSAEYATNMQAYDPQWPSCLTSGDRGMHFQPACHYPPGQGPFYSSDTTQSRE